MSFKPTYPYDLPKLPANYELFNPELTTHLVAARAQLGELKGFSDSLPNPLLLLSPAIVKESLASSEVENINTTLIDVFESQLFSEEERQVPDKEVLRYRDAILWGYKNVEKVSLSTRLILGVNKVLLPNHQEGYRAQQNGLEDRIQKQIIYTPPVQSRVADYMNNLENFMNGALSSEIDPLIRAIISHYQFEAVHPFSDGNGRTGRILMVLSLVEKDLLDLPILYISGYINNNKNEYYKRLLGVTRDNAWNEYIIFMLKGFASQARVTKEYIFKIKNHFYDMKHKIRRENSKIYSADLVEALFSTPILTPTKLAELVGCHYTTASKHLKALEEMGIVFNKKVGRQQLYANKSLIEILH
ncbi:Fic family protein [Candidatus Woesebacteria bacterium]|nr:Fic family protein [Candidatus Woesebacteria bacterium]